jgi:nucleotide-binding universal stress UspA family protein
MTNQEPVARPLIVVGVDGSEPSVAALRWAIRQARSTGGEVRAVLAWEIAAPFGYVPDYGDVDWAEGARDALAQALQGEPDPEVPITAEVVRGHPADVLAEQSRSADLLVVGSRGHGTAAGMVIGSVSLSCVHRAHCPVVVVPSPSRVTGGR